MGNPQINYNFRQTIISWMLLIRDQYIITFMTLLSITTYRVVAIPLKNYFVVYLPSHFFPYQFLPIAHLLPNNDY